MFILFHDLSQFFKGNHSTFIIYMHQGNFAMYFWISSVVFIIISTCCFYQSI